MGDDEISTEFTYICCFIFGILIGETIWNNNTNFKLGEKSSELIERCEIELSITETCEIIAVKSNVITDDKNDL